MIEDYWQKLKKNTEKDFGKSRAPLAHKSFDVLAALNLKKAHEFNLDRSETVIVKNYEEEDEHGNKKVVSKSYNSRDLPDSKKLKFKPVISNSIRYIKSTYGGNSPRMSQLSRGKVDSRKSAFFGGFKGAIEGGVNQETGKFGDLVERQRLNLRKRSVETGQESFQENSKGNSSGFMPA
jgi:hypothetical protein